MPGWLSELLRACTKRGIAFFSRGSSVKTVEYEIHAPTTAGVIAIMEALQEMSSSRTLPQPRKHDSVRGTVQAEEPMTVKG